MIEEKGNDLTQPLDAQDVDVSVNVPIEENKAGEEFKPAPLEENIPNGTEESELEFTKKQIGEISQRALETIGDSNFSSTGLFVASVLLLVKSSADHALHLAPFAITLSVISVLVMFNYFYMLRTNRLEEKPKKILTFILFTIWTISAGVFTFVDPYTATGNGYFACWIGWFCSFKMLMEVYPRAKGVSSSVAGMGLLMGIAMVSSIVVSVAAIRPCAQSTCTGEKGLALAMGIVSAVLCIVLIVMNKKMGLKVQLALLYILVIWWTIGVAVCTFIGPFNVTGNGYFGTWFAFGASLLMLHKLK